MSVRALGAQLRSAGLSPRGLATWAGTDRISALPSVLPAHVTREPVPAAVALSLFVAGVPLAMERAKSLPLEALIQAKLLAVHGNDVYAPAAILPLGPSLIVCDRLDVPDAVDRVSWPDDSSHHLVGAIAPNKRRKRWLDIGCGSAFTQLALPNLADVMLAIDINPRSIAYARQGALLSGVDRLEARHVGVDAIDGARADFVTCNAPLPDAAALAVWRRADPGFFPLLWPAIRRNLTEGGEAILHVARHTIPSDLPGERVIVSYAPDLCVLWWRPDAPDLVVGLERPLTKDRPHIHADDREDALDGAP
jgi:SAM-dependent methyltransferase